MSTYRSEEASLKDYKMRAKRVAKECRYAHTDPTILDRIDACKTELEVTKIIRTARDRM